MSWTGGRRGVRSSKRGRSPFREIRFGRMAGNDRNTLTLLGRLSGAGVLWLVIPVVMMLVAGHVGGGETLGPPPNEKLVFGCDQDFPPFEWLDEGGSPHGFNVDLIRAVGRVMGYDVEVRMGPWPEIRRAFETERTVDVTDMFHTEERGGSFAFATAFRVVHDEIFIRRGSGAIPTLKDLKGREVICQRDGSVSEILAKEVPGAKLILVDGEPDALRLLASGKHDCAVVSEFTGRYVIERNALRNLTATGLHLWPRDYSFVTHKDRADLLEDLNQGLEILRQTGEYNEIYDKWFGDYLPRRPWLEKLMEVLPWVATGLLGVVLAVAAWIITLRRRVSERTLELQKNQALLDGVVNHSPSMIFITDLEGRILLANQQVLEVLGKRMEEVRGKTSFDLFPRETAEELRANDRAVVERGEPIMVEETAVFPDGSHAFESVKFPLRDSDGKVFAVAGIASDITGRRVAEERERRSHEQLRELADRLESVREEERAHLAREAHDVLGQLLTCLKMELARVGKRHLEIPDGRLREALEERMTEAVELADALIKGVRKISSELRPNVLDKLGLAAAIRFEAGRFAKRSGTVVDVERVPEVIDLEPEVATGAFRIFQEILTNVARHAHATEVAISLREDGGWAVMEVCDNGVGITEGQIVNEHSLGLLGMRERTRRFDGRFTIHGKPGEGTTVRVEIPRKQVKGSG